VFTEIGPGVYSVAHRFVDGKNGIVFGTRRAVAIDVCNYPDEGEAMATFICDHGFPADRVILTHGHGDHVLGGPVFAGGEVFAHVQTPAVMRRLLPRWGEHTGEGQDTATGRALWPTITFAGEARIDLGGKTLTIFSTPGHSEDSVCVYLEEDRVLFAGDTAVTGIVPAIGEGDGRQLEQSLARLMTLDIETLVAGHGPVLQGKAIVSEWLEWLHGYLTGVRAHVRQVFSENPRASNEVVDGVEFEYFIGERLAVDQFNMPRRHRNTVLKIIMEERETA